MSLTMISTSMLNSLGFEKQTFFFYFIGAAAMLLSILLLPPVCGIYAYIVGLGASFTLNGLCNIVFLYKKTKFLEKRWKIVCIKEIFPAILSILPISLFGKLCDAVLSHICGEFVAVLLSILLMLALTYFLYFLMGLLHIPTSKRKSKFFIRSK